MKLRLDQEQAWILHEHVRQTRNAPEYGTEHDIQFIQKLWSAILELDQAGREGRSTEIDFTHGELLQVTRQVSDQVRQGSRPIGREILKLVFAALQNPDDGEEAPDVPAVFKRAEYTDDGSSSEDADDGADGNAGAESRPVADLPGAGA
jgi:hypothetical protein